jgi:hypothetical protein
LRLCNVPHPLSNIDRHELIICRYLSSENFDIFADIRDEIREARENTNRQRIVKWLSEGVPNPSKEHNAARAKHEDTTGS